MPRHKYLLLFITTCMVIVNYDVNVHYVGIYGSLINSQWPSCQTRPRRIRDLSPSCNFWRPWHNLTFHYLSFILCICLLITCYVLNKITGMERLRNVRSYYIGYIYLCARNNRCHSIPKQCWGPVDAEWYCALNYAHFREYFLSNVEICHTDIPIILHRVTVIFALGDYAILPTDLV